MADAIVELRGGLEPLVSVKLRGTDLAAVRDGLVERVAQAPGFFKNAPIVVDLSPLSEPAAAALDLDALLVMLREEGLHPVASRARSLDEALVERLRDAGLAMLAVGRNRATPNVRDPLPPADDRPAPAAADSAAPAAEPEPDGAAVQGELVPPPMPAPSMMITRPIRSGQRHYAPHGDLVVVGAVSVGAELIAAGSIHVYGPLRGRALCGAHGDTTARIFCQKMEAELVSVAGTYRALEAVPDNVAGKPATMWLDGDTLNIEPLN